MRGTRRPAKALTVRLVETARNSGKYFDGNGLFLRISGTGSRQWVQRIVIRGKRCELGLGSPELASLVQVRQIALENRRMARNGIDPRAARREAHDSMCFSEAVERFLAAKAIEYRSAKHRKQWRATLVDHANPILGGKPVGDIAASDILRVLEPIWLKRTETASRLRGRIEAVLSWATAAGYRKGDNPARWKGNLSELLAKPGRIARSRHFPALALRDARRWWRDLAARDGMAARALQFLAMTGARSGEVRGMLWNEVDLETAVWSVPATRMKTQNEHRVPLPQAATALLRGLPRMAGSDHVFFAPRGGPYSDMSISAVMRRMHETDLDRTGGSKSGAGDGPAAGRGYCDPQSGRPAVPHGLRSTLRVWAAENGYEWVLAELALAHRIGSQVERAYQRSDLLERRRRMQERWVEFLTGEGVGGPGMPTAGNRKA